MNRRSRSACLTGALLTVLLTAGPALATDPIPNEGVVSGDGLSPLETIALYVGVPFLILFVLGGLAWATGAEKGARYRPTRGWDNAPVWFAGPADPGAAVASADQGTVVRGGASGNW